MKFSFITTFQNRAVTISIAILGLLVIVLLMTLHIRKYENHLAHGDSVLLALAPVDPRGFMQGDYMALRYALEDDIFTALDANNDNDNNNDINLNASDGYVIVALDSNRVGHFVRLADHNQRDALAANELPIYYRIRQYNVKLATNAFFFQEGHAEAFEAAKYGLFRVNKQGEPLLAEMVNEQLELIKGTSIQDEISINEPVIEESLKNTGRQGSGM